MNKNKRKSEARFRILTPHWYNPFIWIVAIIYPLFHGLRMGIKATMEAYREIFHIIRDYN